MDSDMLKNDPLSLSSVPHETLKCWRLLWGYFVVFVLLTTVSTGSTCQAPSSPQCFRRKVEESVYICEWGMNTTESDVTFDLYFDETKFGDIKSNYSRFNEEQLIRSRPVHIWVEAHVGNSSCTSARRSVVLRDTVKYEAPQKINMSWLQNNLKLSWEAAEKHPALSEIRFRRYEQPTESWERRTTNTSTENSVHHVIVENLSKQTAYQVQIRQRSNQASNPLWSDWSPDVTVPAELEQKPEVRMNTKLLNGTREVILMWKPMPHAVNYRLTDTQSSRGCQCDGKKHHLISLNKHTIYLSYSAVNISVIAENAAGSSPPAIIQVPAKTTADLEICDKTLLYGKMKKRTCLELWEFQDGEIKPDNVIILRGKKNKKQRNKIIKTIKDVHYLYYEHRCNGRRPQTVEMCHFYKNEDVPHTGPLDLSTANETHSSVMLTWKAIPTADRRGLLTHHSLCIAKISPQKEPKVCHNISASLTKHCLENLTPGAKYNVTLAGVTRKGKGPEVSVIFETLPEKPMNVLWSLSLLLLFFFISTSCPFVFKRIKPKICPPIPTPVIPDFTSDKVSENQEMLERKEEVHELTLHQLQPQSKSINEDTEETTVPRGQRDDGTVEDGDNERGDSRSSGGSSDECSSQGSVEQALKSTGEGEMTDLEQLDNEIAMLVYRNGLVFDVKTDSP